jgi:murein DD-endopeptidase MepM/ murein hydrolase activator NlpD
VRTRGEQDRALPEYLYQELSMNALSLMATLPRGTFAVSIPHQSESVPGYPIRKSPPSAAEGFVVIYSAQPNRRYEAVEILCQGRSFGIAEFCEFANRSLENQIGRMRTIPERFAYFAPARDLWGVIQRDNGYTALDPSRMESSLTVALLQSRQLRQSSGVLARIPVQTGDRMAQQTPLPIFARVELTLESKPCLQSNWVSFDEYQRTRALQSQPPAVIIPAFREWLVRFTTESRFESWIFHPGMRFGDPIEWWGDRNRRRTEHEGLDFAEGKQMSGQICAIPGGTPVRAMAEGQVVSLLQDFLGQTVVVCHTGVTDETGRVFHSLYSHIQPEVGLSGKFVSKGQILGQMGKSTSLGAPAHFHLTAAWIPQSIPPGHLTLDHIHPGFAPVVLINFNIQANHEDHKDL